MKDVLRHLVDAANRPASWPRPPGAVAEEDFLLLCTRCEECIVACPHGAIGRLPAGAGPARDTPAMNTNVAPCHLCEDMPCIAACQDGALEPITPEFVFFGLARIETDKCFVFKGPECGACKPACPTGAIRLSLGRPEIELDACNGCGLCREACPVWGKAIVIDL